MPHPRSRIDPVSALIWVFAALACALAVFRVFDPGEIEHMHATWHGLAGRLPFVDFFEHHHPLLWYTLAPILAAVGESARTLIVFRLIFLGLTFAIARVTYLLALEIGESRQTARLAVLLLLSTTTFVSVAIEIRPDVPLIDGVFARDRADLRFCPAPWLTTADVADVLATIVPRVRGLLERRGVGDGEEGEEGASAADEWAEDAPVLAGMAGASVQGTFALGPRAGKRARPCGAVPVEDQRRAGTVPGSGRCHACGEPRRTARQKGFDLETGLFNQDTDTAVFDSYA
jgi:hypothetical protein